MFRRVGALYQLSPAASRQAIDQCSRFAVPANQSTLYLAARHLDISAAEYGGLPPRNYVPLIIK